MGGEKRKITMMMTDLRGFTSLSERWPPERVVAILNRHLATMVPIIKQYQGTIDEFIGDAIFVLVRSSGLAGRRCPACGRLRHSHAIGHGCGE